MVFWGQARSFPAVEMATCTLEKGESFGEDGRGD
jgi:hypothetical protein